MFRLSALCISAICVSAIAAAGTPHPPTATIARDYLGARNSRDHNVYQQWVDKYAFRTLSRLEKFDFSATEKYGVHTYKKVVFDTPYESIIEVQDGQNHKCHLTFWFDSKGKVDYIMLIRDSV